MMNNSNPLYFEDKYNLEKPIAKFEELVKSRKHDFIRIVVSRHWASDGIWIEFEDNSIEDPSLDHIIKEYRKKKIKFNISK